MPDGYELTGDDRTALRRYWQERYKTSFAQIIRVEAMNHLSEEIRQEALDADRSADRPLGIRGRIAAWYRAHRHRSPRGPLQRLQNLVRRVVASLPRL